MDIIGKLRRLLNRQRPPRQTGSVDQQALPTDLMLQNQDFDLHLSRPCPHCKATDVARILYGKPALTRQILEGLETGKIISGGCLIHPAAPQWHCNLCNTDFGQLEFAPAATGEKI